MPVLDNLFAKLTKPLGKGSAMHLQPGMYHYSSGDSFDKNQIHLRVEPDGFGILILNANQILHLNQTATRFAYYFLEKTPENDILSKLAREYRIDQALLKRDYEEFNKQFSLLIEPNSGACPICDLGIETTMPFSHIPSAPYRMDLAITYRCNNDCLHCYNARSRQYPELETNQWKTILEKLWSLGIPHIVFTGGEPTLRQDLNDLISHAQKIGQITGLNTNGRKLRDDDFVKRMVQSGLDHVQITLESQIEEIHDQMVCAKGAWKDTVAGIKNAVREHLYVMTNTTLLVNNKEYTGDLIDYLADLGVKTVGLNALIYSGKGKTVGTGLKSEKLPEILNIAREKTAKNKQRLIWYTPTQYCHFDPVQMELGVKGCTAALFNMCIEPDGSVIPCQSFYSTLGNIQVDSWESIWNHSLARKLRERKITSAKCLNCAFISECGGGCPLASSEFEPDPEKITQFELG